jgi:hypothetical protein
MRFVTIRVIGVFVAIVACAIGCRFSNAQESPPAKEPSPNPSSLSPDKKWEYQEPGDETGPKIVKTGTSEAAGDLSDVCDIGSCGGTTLMWAPDSKRFAFNWGQGRVHQTALYQLRGDGWEALKSPNDDVNEILNKTIKRGLSKKTHLRLIWETVKVHQWVDSNTAILYGGLEVDEAFGAHFLLTLKFDEAGNWKIIRTQRLSLKEAEKL